MELLIATDNCGKFREIQNALRSLPIRLRSLTELPSIFPVDELGRTYEENAAIKAFAYASQTGLCALADDSGLEVDVLGGIPGVFSARYAGNHATDIERIDKLLRALSSYSDTNRSARFICVMALVAWSGEAKPFATDGPRLLKVTEGRCEGFISKVPRGTNGFGFDSVFVPSGYDLTFAELPDEVKAKVSHRALALDAMREFLDRKILELQNTQA
jgi:XTP/dITP diphosphohydrolase